jgi:hypothetical protein
MMESSLESEQVTQAPSGSSLLLTNFKVNSYAHEDLSLSSQILQIMENLSKWITLFYFTLY